MEVETTPSQKHIKVHPLSILSISDHHTRITSGGSALPPSSPTIGLLFGTSTPTALTIIDAEELDPTIATTETSAYSLVQTKISLHRAVFSNHTVLGWYRVAINDDEDPTPEDLRRSQCEISQYISVSPTQPLLFMLVKLPSTNENRKKSMEQLIIQNDDQLPLMLYEMEEGVFIHTKFELETFDPERIALEKVFRDAPVPSVEKQVAVVKEEEEKRKVKKSKKEETNVTDVTNTVDMTPSKLDDRLENLQFGVGAMNARMQLLLEYLRKVERGEVERDEALLRDIDGLLQKLPLVEAALMEGVTSSGGGRVPFRELENDYSEAMLVSYLAAVAKTAKCVHGYTEKYRGAFESRKG